MKVVLGSRLVKERLGLLLALVCLTAVLEVMPFIHHARAFLSPQFPATCDCWCALWSRPWYGQLNIWLVLWVLFTPLFLLALRSSAPQRWWWGWSGACVLFSYTLLNIALHKGWHIRNVLFQEGVESFASFTIARAATQCAVIADGASLVTALLLGWVPATLYVLICLVIRKVWRKNPKA